MSSPLTGILTPLDPSTTSLTQASAASKDSPEKIRHAASQFEGLLIGQVLKSVHDDEDGGWLGTGEDQTAGAAIGMADEFFATALAGSGGLGLAKMISAGLERRTQAAPAEPPSD